MYKRKIRSAMKLVKTVYFKVSKEKVDYFIKRRSYASRCDGEIITDFITEETFDKNLEKGKKVEFYKFKDAPIGIKRHIENRYKNEVS